ncbi:phage tail tape measure protein [Cupriavidus basilensis]|uniref:phage tail tape measure protein n=1 Tax=Cupriavidus basilensis TaxID=68895 RepID=UPI0039F6F161
MADEAAGGVVAGKATLQVGADVTGVHAGMQAAERSVKQFESATVAAGRSTAGSMRTVGEAAGEAAQTTDAATRRFLASLQRESSQVGKTRSEWLAYRAAQLGVSQQAEAMLAPIRESEKVIAKTGVSAAQTAAALRGVPAQFTDIVTSLAGGQNGMLVLTQQGGQLKDMFGGVVPAAKALGSYIAGLVTPLTLAAAAAGALALATHQGSAEQTAFQKSLIVTGNYAGVSANQLVGMSAEIGKVIGTQGQAAEALNQLAGTGKIAGDQLQTLGTATVAWGKATGAAVKDTVAHFVELGEEPVKASVKLNEQYHYLTESVYLQIRALQEQGDKDQAAALAQKTYADALTSRANQVLANLGFMERGWNLVSGAAKGAWDSMLGLGRPDTLADVKSKIAAVKAEIDKEGKATGFDSSAGGAALGNGDKRRAGALARLKALQLQESALEADSTKAAAESAKQRTEAEKIAARDRLEAQSKATRSKAEKRKDELDQLKRDADKVGMAADEYNKRAAAIEESYKDKAAPKGKAYTEDYATRYLDQLRQAGAAVKAQLGDADKLTAAEKQRAEFEQQIADIKTKKVLTADQKSLLARQDEIRAQLALNVAADAALESKKAETKEAEKQKRLAEEARVQAAGIDVRLRESAAARADQYDRQLSVFGMGSQAQEQLQSAKGMYREFARIRTDWIKSMTDKDQLNSPLYQTELDKINDAEREALGSISKYYDQLAAKRGDWKNGATAALADYRDYAANVADQTGRLFGGMFQGMEDSVVNFAMTGKLSFADFAKSVIADLVRIQARAALSGLAQMGISMAGSMFGGGDSMVGAGAFDGAAGAAAGASASAATPLAGDYFGTAGSVSGSYAQGLFSLPARADGGPVGAGTTYLVGERGPELFKPNQSGSIVPNHALGGGGGDINVSTQLYMADGTAQSQTDGGSGATAKQLGDMITGVVRDTMVRESRQGGLLWKMKNGQG